MTGFQRFISYFLILFVASCVFATFVTAGSNQDFVHSHEHLRLRSDYKDLKVTKVQSMQHMAIQEKKEWGFYGHSTITHDYELKSINGDKVVIDHATGLMWHQSGSTYGLNWEKANRWVRLLNKRGYAQYSDWRLPTIEEAASLLDSSKTHNYSSLKSHEHNNQCYKHQCEKADLDPCDRCDNAHNCDILCCKISCYDVTRCDTTASALECSSDDTTVAGQKDNDRFINPIFDKTQGWIWSGDSYYYLEAAWRVDFFRGLVDWDVYEYRHYYARPVRNYIVNDAGQYDYP